MTAVVPLYTPVLSFKDNNGNALNGGQLFSYQAGSSIQQALYTDSTGSVQCPNPVILNARGEAQAWALPNTAYKFVLQDANNNTIWTEDNVTAPLTSYTLTQANIGAALYPYNSSLSAINSIFPSNYSTTQNLYVATTGSDSNNGTTSGTPFLTLQKAVNTIANFGPVVSGVWVINMAGGTYGAGCTFPAGLQSSSGIVITGPSGGLPFVPSAIISGTTTAIVANGVNNISVQNVYFQNCTSSGVGVISCQTFGQLYLVNCYFSNCDYPIKVQQGRFYMSGGYITGGVVGITCISSGETHTIGYGASITATSGNYGGAGVGPYITGCSQAGILLQEMATGHIDYTGINNCAVGVDIVVYARANCNFSAMTNNATCAMRLRDSNWNDNGTSALFSGNGTDILLYSSSEYTRQGNWTIPRRQPVDAVYLTETGGTAPTNPGPAIVKTYAGAIGAVGFNTQVKNFRIRIVGTMTGTAGTKVISVNLDGSTIVGFTTGSVAGDFLLDCECIAYSTSQQSYEAHFIQNGQTPLFKQGPLAITPSAGTITILETINGSADTISLRTVTIWNEGGF